MKFILFVEGESEKKILPVFLHKWLDTRLNNRVRIDPIKFRGWADLVKNSPQSALLELNGPEKDEIIAVISLFDLYGPDHDDFYPAGRKNSRERYNWAKQELEKRVNHIKFRQFFAVHETEAWLLSDPTIFPSAGPAADAASTGNFQHDDEGPARKKTGITSSGSSPAFASSEK